MKKAIFIFIFLSLQVIHAQTSADSTDFVAEYKPGIIYTIKTTIGTSHRGYVVNETKEAILLESKNSHDTLRIKKINIIGSRKTNDHKTEHVNAAYEENEHAINYLISSSAFLFDEQTSTSNAHWFLLDNLDYAFTENVAITTNVFLFYPTSIGLKCAFKIDELNFVGANAFVVGDIFSGGTAGLFIGYSAFAKYTHGTGDKNFTVSGGVLGINSEYFVLTPKVPFVNFAFGSLSYCNRFSKNVALNAEGWYFPEMQSGIGGLGLKIIKNPNICWSFGCFTFLENSHILTVNSKPIPIPYVGYLRKFN